MTDLAADYVHNHFRTYESNQSDTSLRRIPEDIFVQNTRNDATPWHLSSSSSPYDASNLYLFISIHQSILQLFKMQILLPTCKPASQ